MTIHSLQTTGNLPLQKEDTPPNMSIFFEIYDFDLVPPTLERDQILFGKTLDAVSDTSEGTEGAARLKTAG